MWLGAVLSSTNKIGHDKKEHRMWSVLKSLEITGVEEAISVIWLGWCIKYNWM